MPKISTPFLKEAFWYNHAYPTLLKQFPILKGIAPRCFYAYSNYEAKICQNSFWDKSLLFLPIKLIAEPVEKGIILLENASKKTSLDPNKPLFHMRNKHQIVSAKQGQVAFETLAHFHGAWFQWLNTSEECMNGMNRHLVFSKINLAKTLASAPIMTMAKATCRNIVKLLRMHGKDEEIIARYEDFVQNKLKEEIKKVFRHFKETQLKTMCHGDFWINNMLFTEDDEKVTFIDFQMMGICPIGLDFWYFLYFCTDSKWRGEHLKPILRTYYQIFIEYYEKVPNLKPLSYEDFEKEIFALRLYGFIMGAECVPNMLTPEKWSYDNVTLLSFKSAMENRRMKDICGENVELVPERIEIRRRLIDLVEEAAKDNFF